MNPQFQQTILNTTGATALHEIEMIQSLWSGYGKIVRYGLEGGEYPTIVAKQVQLPQGGNHPRGWNADISHQRKVKSYEIETNWYKHYAKECSDLCKVPECIVYDSLDGEVLIVLEDLDQSGYPIRKHSVTWDDIENCLKWLANFHATFMNRTPEGLWSIGTYWHLDTRPDELEALDDQLLRNAAEAIDAKLNSCKYKTFVHGDAKLANFCFGNNGEVAAVDFQYVGGGCGMKDVAYFVGSCLAEADCESSESDVLSVYFKELEKAYSGSDFDELEKEWREMYHVAWADFHRFLKGWSPGHWKINTYSERVCSEVVKSLKF